MTMRFEYYHAGLNDVRKLSVDGTVSNSIHFSHWEGNRTPAAVKADTSTEIALNLVASPEREQLTERIELAMESVARGRSRVEEDAATGLSLITLAPGLYGSQGFKPTRHAAPFTAITANAHGQVFLIALPMMNGWSYRVDYPYYSWAETIVRPHIKRRDFNPLIARLNELERRDAQRGNAQGHWALDGREMTSAIKFM